MVARFTAYGILKVENEVMKILMTQMSDALHLIAEETREPVNWGDLIGRINRIAMEGLRGTEEARLVLDGPDTEAAGNEGREGTTGTTA